jgi:hypothetical protein
MIKSDGSRIYAGFGGAVIDPDNHALAGTFVAPATGLPLDIAVVPDVALDRVFLISRNTLDSSLTVLCVFERTTFRYVGCTSIPVSVPPGSSPLVRWGDDGLAFRTADRVYLLRPPEAWLGTKPALSVSPTTLAFPVQSVGTTSTSRTIRLTNNTGLPIAISSATISGDFSPTNGCGSVIQGFTSCSITITFTPTAAGTRPGMLTIVDEMTGTHIVGLSGVGNGSNPLPWITSISPAYAAVGSAGFTLTVNGTNFVSGSVIRWNGQDRTTTFVNGSTLTTTIQSGDLTGIASANISVFNPSPDGGLSNAAVFVVFRAFDLTTNELIWESSTRRIYAAIPASAPNGNSILPIDPANATLGPPIATGFEPQHLAASDNGQYLYASQKFGALIRRIDLASQTAGQQFALSVDQLGHQYGAYKLQVLPGFPTALAVAHNYTNMTGMGPVGVYDNGIKRPTDTGPFLGSMGIVFSNTADKLYGVDEYWTQFRTMSVNGAGVTVTNNSPLPMNGSEIKFSNGLIYSPAGTVIEPLSDTLAGKLQTGLSYYSVVPDPTLNLIFLLSQDGVISAFNRFDLTLVGNLNVFGYTVFSNPSLLRWGNDGLAYRTETQVILVRIPNEWAVAAPTHRRAQITSQ